MKLLSIFSALIFTSSLYSMEEEPWGDKEMKNLQNFRNEHPDIDGVIAREFLGFKGDLNDAQEDAINGFKSLSLEQINIMEKQVIPTMKKTFPTTTQAHYYTIFLGSSNFFRFRRNMTTLRTIKKTEYISSHDLQELQKFKKENSVFFDLINDSIPLKGPVALSNKERYRETFMVVGPVIAQRVVYGAFGGAALALISSASTGNLQPATVGTSALWGGAAGAIYTIGKEGCDHYQKWLKNPEDIRDMPLGLHTQRTIQDN